MMREDKIHEVLPTLLQAVAQERWQRGRHWCDENYDRKHDSWRIETVKQTPLVALSSSCPTPASQPAAKHSVGWLLLPAM